MFVAACYRTLVSNFDFGAGLTVDRFRFVCKGRVSSKFHQDSGLPHGKHLRNWQGIRRLRDRLTRNEALSEIGGSWICPISMDGL